jgi:NADPH:quinone reductase-like Zn-dependent oxidoreductase
VKSLDADKVIDYTQDDFTQTAEKYDVVFDAVLKLASSKAKTALKPGGIDFSIGKQSGEKTQDLIELKKLIEAGKLRAIIDRCYPLELIVDAHRYVESGHKKGNVVITVNQSKQGIG